MAQAWDGNKIMLNNVRIIYPNLFKYETYQGESRDKYSVKFVIPKSGKMFNMIEAECAELYKRSKIKPRVGKETAWKDCDEGDDEIEELAGHMTLKATNKKRFTIIDRTRSPVHDDDNLFYSGCRVNAQISMYVLEAEKGKFLGANLHGIQFYKNDEPLEIGGGASASRVDEFEAFDDDEEDEAPVKKKKKSAYF